MIQPDGARRTPSARLRQDDGAAMLEFAIVISLLMVIVLGSLCFGVLLAYRHSFDEVSSEAARSAVVVTNDPSTAGDEREDQAMSTLNASNGMPGKCSDAASGLHCSAHVHPCDGEPSRSCITVEILLDRSVNPVVGRIPLIDALMPSTLRSTATAVVNT